VAVAQGAANGKTPQIRMLGSKLHSFNLRKLGPIYSHAPSDVAFCSFALWFFYAASFMYKPLTVFFGLASFANFRSYMDPPNTHVLSTLYYGDIPLKIFISVAICTLLRFNKAEKACLLCKPAYI
jgi:hypothetical protein